MADERISNNNGSSESASSRPASRRNRRPKNRDYRRGNSNRSGSDRDERVDASATPSTSALNDVSWYKRYPLLAETAAKFQFMNRPGDFVVPGAFGTEAVMKEFPGIMRIEWRPALGSSSDNSSPASICAKGIWDKIRDAYSGTLHADPPDIFLYMMHLCQFKAFISWFKRTYGVINMYTPFNNYAPKVLFSAMFPNGAGLITDETFFKWMAAKNDIVFYINQLVAMMNKYVIPNNMAIFDRQSWMCENIYRDSSTVLSQLYVFAPEGFFCVQGTDVPHGTKADFIPFRTGEGRYDIRDPEQAFRYGIQMYTALANWGDARTINGYLMRAFEGNLMPMVPEMEPSYTVEPTYSAEVNLQIHNIRVLETYREQEWSQNAATGAIICEPDPDSLISHLDDPVLDIPVDIPSEDAVIVASRLCPVIERITNTAGTVVAYARVGTEVVTGLFLALREDSTTAINSSTWSRISFLLVNQLSMADGRRNNLARRLLCLAQYTAFNDAPIMPLSYTEAGSDSGASAENQFHTFIGNLTNMASIPIRTMARLHLVCQQSEFNIFRARLG